MPILSHILSLGSAIFFIMLLVIVHELGHYLAAKAVGIPVQCVSIGIGPPLFSRTWKGEKWQICCIPFGGFVQINSIYALYEEDASEAPNESKLPVPLWKRTIVILAGPLSNFLLAFGFFSFLWMAGGTTKSFRDLNPFIGEIHPKSDLKKLGLHSGDRLLSYSGYPVLFFQDHFSSKGPVSDVQVEALSIGYQGKETIILKGSIDSFPLKKGVDAYGVLAPGNFILYQSAIDPAAPIVSSGIREKDRILWANGNLTFCFESLEDVLAGESILCTIRTRTGKMRWKRLNRVYLIDLMDSIERMHQIKDLIFDSTRPSYTPTWWIPYLLSHDLVVREKLSLQEGEGLEIGDKILSIQGAFVDSLEECVRSVQTRKIFLIVGREPYSHTLEDVLKAFEQPFHDERLYSLIHACQPGSINGPFAFLQPIEMMSRQDLVPEQMKDYRQLLRQWSFGSLQSDIYADFLNTKAKQLILGGSFSDQIVRWKPLPWSIFSKEIKQNINLFLHLFTHWSKPKLMGPIGIVKHLYGKVQEGPSHFLYLVGALSLQLGLFNLLPIPVLDGGHLLFITFEAFLGRPLPLAFIQKIFFFFFSFFWLLILFYSLSDLSSLFH